MARPLPPRKQSPITIPGGRRPYTRGDELTRVPAWTIETNLELRLLGSSYPRNSLMGYELGQFQAMVKAGTGKLSGLRLQGIVLSPVCFSRLWNGGVIAEADFDTLRLGRLAGRLMLVSTGMSRLGNFPIGILDQDVFGKPGDDFGLLGLCVGAHPRIRGVKLDRKGVPVFANDLQ
jgi:hypothetical protein